MPVPGEIILRLRLRQGQSETISPRSHALDETQNVERAIVVSNTRFRILRIWLQELLNLLAGNRENRAQ